MNLLVKKFKGQNNQSGSSTQTQEIQILQQKIDLLKENIEIFGGLVATKNKEQSDARVE